MMDELWTKKLPIVGGWYNHRKDGKETKYFLRAFGQLNPLMPHHLLLAYESESGKVGKNIICDLNGEFANCEWNGPLSDPLPKVWAY